MKKIFLIMFLLLFIISPHIYSATEPKITISEEEWDFDAINQGKKLSHKFIIKNEGSTLLEITKIRPSCKCITYKISSKQIEPGKKAKLKVVFDSKKQKGDQKKKIYIHSNSPTLPVLILKINGFVKTLPGPKIKVKPNKWYLGKLNIGDTKDTKITISNIGDRTLKIKKIVTSNGCNAKLVSLKKIPPKTDGYIEVALNPIKEGQDTIDETIMIYSNDKNSPEVEISVFGYVRKKIPSTLVWMYLFHSPDCDSCERIKNKFIPQLSDNYPLKVVYRDISNYKDYQSLLDLEKTYGDFGEVLPVLVIGKDVLEGEKEIKRQLEDKIKHCIAKGGVKLPQVSGQNDLIKRKTETIYIALFTQPGCKGCNRVKYMLQHLKSIYPNIVVEKFNPRIKEDLEIQEAVSELIGIPYNKRFLVPAVCIGNDYLIKKEITDINLRQLIEKHKLTGSRCLWENAEKLKNQAHAKILDRFRFLTLPAIIFAGLLDGINPCAFATIIFFISYLVFIKKKRKDIILVGISFTLAVFITYLLSGLGAWQIIQSLGIFPFLSRCFYFLIIILTLILSGYSFYDYYLSKKGHMKDIKLQLPMFIKKRIHNVIRERMKTRSYIVGAFIIGFLVSLLELVCTGQIYLPTITFAVKTSKFGFQPIIYLIIYNLMFILPLIIVFSLTTYGVGSERLQLFLKRNIGRTKLSLAIFFLLLALLLIFFIV